MAGNLDDIDLLSRLEGDTDLIVMESKYHIACYTDFENGYRTWRRKSSGNKTSHEMMLSL